MQQTESIIKKVRAALERDTRINMHTSSISVTASDDAVVLAGEVLDIATKRAAVDAAIRVLHGELTVTDRLQLKQPTPRQDLELRQDVIQALVNEPVFDEYTLRARATGKTETLRDRGAESKTIQVGIQNGTITLSGEVVSLSHGRLAEVLMWWTDGCQNVDNQLQLVPPEQDNDNEITDAVRIVLEKDPLVHADQLKFATAGGVVDLTGSLATREEKQLAIYDTWCIPGVADVVDRIESRD